MFLSSERFNTRIAEYQTTKHAVGRVNSGFRVRKMWQLLRVSIS